MYMNVILIPNKSQTDLHVSVFYKWKAPLTICFDVSSAHHHHANGKTRITYKLAKCSPNLGTTTQKHNNSDSNDNNDDDADRRKKRLQRGMIEKERQQNVMLMVH